MAAAASTNEVKGRTVYRGLCKCAPQCVRDVVGDLNPASHQGCMFCRKRGKDKFLFAQSAIWPCGFIHLTREPVKLRFHSVTIAACEECLPLFQTVIDKTSDDLEWLPMSADKDRATAMQQRMETTVFTGISCQECHRVEYNNRKFKVCSKCRDVTYCSKECQVANWPSHKGVCALKTKAKSDKKEARNIEKKADDTPLQTDFCPCFNEDDKWAYNSASKSQCARKECKKAIQGPVHAEFRVISCGYSETPHVFAEVFCSPRCRRKTLTAQSVTPSRVEL